MVDAAAVTKLCAAAAGGAVKFLCSYGGKILPRHPDGKLRYHGGHTRLLSVHRSISFSELLAKVGDLCGSEEVTLRCQLPTEDLDALVSIKSDEDLANLIEEYDLAASPSQTLKIRAFLFVPKSSPRSVVSPNGSRSALARSVLPPLPSGARRRCVHQGPMMMPLAPIWYEKPTSKVARHVPRNSGHELTADLYVGSERIDRMDQTWFGSDTDSSLFIDASPECESHGYYRTLAMCEYWRFQYISSGPWCLGQDYTKSLFLILSLKPWTYECHGLQCINWGHIMCSRPKKPTGSDQGTRYMLASNMTFGYGGQANRSDP